MKRIFAALLASACLFTTPVFAAANSTDNFIRSRTYTGQFSDLPQNSVFYQNVAALYEYGLSVGKADGTFGLQDSVTVGQMLIFAGRIRSLYRTGSAEQGAASYQTAGDAAYLPYLRYLQREGVLGSELDGSYFQPATRGQVAHILANTLPGLPELNNDAVTQGYASRRYITDVTEYTPYYRDILSLYRTGVSAGSDGTGAFLPEQTITRGAAAAMLTRMVDADLRVVLDWNVSDNTDQWTAAGTTLADLVEPGTYIAAPVTAEEIRQSVLYMLAQNSNVLSLQYPNGVTAVFARTIMQRALETVKQDCEQCYNAVTCTFSNEGDLTLTFSAGSVGETSIQQYRSKTMDAAIAVHDQLWSNGTITAQSTQYERAKAYYTWICENCVYDYQADESSISHIAYSLFYNGKAVCDGYTGAYNLLLKLEGIDCTTLSNSSHIWTVATLDGVTYHIDTTWGDSGSSIQYNYFAMTPEQSWTYHSWS